jgi:AraC-like DNA-binding protein
MGMADQSTSIPEKFIIPAECRERFLPLRLPALQVLRNFGVETGGISEVFPPYEIGRPDPSHHVVLMIIDGTAHWRNGSAQGIIQPGETWVLPSHQPHHYWPDDRWHLAWLHLSDIERWSLLRGEPAQMLPFPHLDQVAALMDGLLAEMLLPEVDQANSLAGYAQLLAVLLERMLRRFDDPRAAREHRMLMTLKEAIAAQPAFPWCNTELARHLGLSVSALKRLTQRVEMKAPMEIVSGLRIQQTQELLHSTDYTLARIAMMVGYATPFALSRAFKVQVGLSPQAYRKGTLSVK